jgi:hypothetical protein
MGGTSIKRKERKNRVKAKRRQQDVKLLTKRPVLKNIDVEAIKETFNKKPSSGKSSPEKQPESNNKQQVEDKKKENTEKKQSVSATEKPKSEATEVTAQSNESVDSGNASSAEPEDKKTEEKATEDNSKE